MILDIVIISAIILVGLILILAEIFLLPGITIAGIAGAIILTGGYAYAFFYLGSDAGYTAIAISGIVGIGGFIFLVKSKTLDHFALKTNIDSKVDQSDKLQIKTGDKGITISRINPIGKAEFENGLVVEVKSFTGEFIDSQIEIKVAKTDSSAILIEPVNHV